MMQLERGKEARSPLNPKPYTLNKNSSKRASNKKK